MCWLLIVSSAFAGGYFHPNDIATESERFRSASEQLIEPVDQAQLQAKVWAKALVDYEEALDLWGPGGSTSEREQLQALRTQYSVQFEGLQQFTDTFVTDFDLLFSDAMARQLVRHPDAVPCERSLPAGPRMPGLPARVTANPECKGEDLNPALASSIDQDTALQAGLDELLNRTWPTIVLDASPVALSDNPERWIAVGSLAHSLLNASLRQIDKDDRMARSALELELHDEMTAEAAQALSERTRTLNASTAQERHDLFSPVRAAVDKLCDRWTAKGEPSTGWCLRPVKLGGCAGEDATDALWARLQEERAIQRLQP